MPITFEYEVFAEETEQGGLLADPLDKAGPDLETQPVTGPAEMSSLPEVSFKDMDGDGDKDIVVTTHSGAKSYWLENPLQQASTNLFTHQAFQSIIPTALSVGDINGDGRDDVVVGHKSGAKVFTSDNEDWRMEDIGIKLSNPQTIVLADINRDNHTDILVRDAREVVLALNSDNIFGVYSMSWPNLGNSSLLEVADFNTSNTMLEILTLNDKGNLGLASHDGTRWQSMQPVSDVTMDSFKVMDLNNDGLPDVYAQNTNGENLWLENDGRGGVIVHSPDEILPKSVTESIKTPSNGKKTLNILPKRMAEPSRDTSSIKTIHDSDGGDRGHTNYFLCKSIVSDTFSQPVKPEPVKLSFDFDAPRDFSVDADPHTTADYSDSATRMQIDLDTGHALGHSGYRYGSSFDWWEDTDSVVNAIGSAKNDFMDGNDHDNVMKGGCGNDYLFGNDGDDTLIGGNGRDVMSGNDGNDVLTGDNGKDVLYGGKGNDLVIGGKNDDVLFGNDGNDTLIGDSGNDLLFAGNGDDLIQGGSGQDVLFGHEGSDTFHYASPNQGGDIIADFESGIDFLAFDFGSQSLRTVTEPYTGDGGDAGETFVWEQSGDGTGKLYFDADGSVSGDETLIAEITLDQPDDTLTTDDILLVG